MGEGRRRRVRGDQATGWLVLLPLVAGCPKGNPLDTDGPEPPTVIEHCGTITDAEVWEADVGHRLTCDVVVEGSLTLEPGVEVVAERDTALRIHGGVLDAVGDQHEPLLLASAESFPVAGDWVGLVALDATVNLAYATVRHAGSEGALVELTGGTASLSNLILSNSIQRGLYAEGTEFSLLEELEIAYTDEPITIPWAAAALLSGVYLDQVDGAAVRLLGDTLDVPVGLGAIGVPYLSGAITVGSGGNLWVDEGAILALSGDVVVDAGGSIVIRGVPGNTAAVIGWEGAGFLISIHRDVTLADFRWASLVGGRVESDAAALSFRYSDIDAAPGVGLTITGGLDHSVHSQLSGSSFTGSGYGMVVPIGLVPSIGENDYSGSSFDGLVVAGGTVSDTVDVSIWPPGEVLVDGELRLTGPSVTLGGPAILRFDSGGALVVDGAQLVVFDMTFTHVGEIPGGWQGVTVTGQDAVGVFDRSVLAYGGSWGSANLTLDATAFVRDCTLLSSAGWGILVGADVEVDLEGNDYQDNAQGDVGQGS